MREFPLPALHGDGGGGTICKLVPLCSLIAQTEGLRFWPPHSHNFLLICRVCISATIVLCKGFPGICANFHCRHYTAMVEVEQFASSYRFVR